MAINPVQNPNNPQAAALYGMLNQGAEQGAKAQQATQQQSATSQLQNMLQDKAEANATASKQQDYTLAQQGKGADQERNMAGIQSLNDNGLIPDGGGAKVGDVGVSKGYNPAATAGVGVKQGQAFLKTAQGAYKGINDQLDAGKSTIDNLNLGNATGDQLARINEAKLSLAGSGGRAIGQMVSHLSGDPTMASDSQKALNWLQNTPNIPLMQPAERDAMRETVFNRLPQIEQQHKTAQGQLGQQGAIVAPGTDYNGIIKSMSDPASQRLQELQGMQSQYNQQRQAMQKQGNAPVSAQSTASANPTMLDKLKGLFGGGSAPQAAPQQSAPQAASAPAGAAPDMQSAIAAEIARRKPAK